jgi:23S rRNA (adenine-N6)-dimethyltransferase
VAAPARHWGWHQLHPAWAARLVADADLPRNALVLDVGAGEGALTALLLDAGHRVVAVELHPGRAALLRARFGADVIVVQADASALRLPRRGYHVVANPPFDVTTPLLRRLLQPGTRLLSAHLVLQEQAARRWSSAGAPGANRWLAVHDPMLGPRVPRHAFRPPPAVDARVLSLRRRAGATAPR